MNRSIFAAILGMTLLLFSYPMLSETRGSVHGKVWDPTGAVIVGATVTVRNIVSGQTWMAQTGQDGEYEIDFVQTGHYGLTAEAKGFQPAMQYTIIAAGQRVEVNFHLVLAVAATGEGSVADVPAALETRNTISRSCSAHFQDQFDATERLALNYGGRLDLFQFITG
jgi:Carboxypeptidase regulatory-like domain